MTVPTNDGGSGDYGIRDELLIVESGCDSGRVAPGGYGLHQSVIEGIRGLCDIRHHTRIGLMGISGMSITHHHCGQPAVCNRTMRRFSKFHVRAIHLA